MFDTLGHSVLYLDYTYLSVLVNFVKKGVFAMGVFNGTASSAGFIRPGVSKYLFLVSLGHAARAPKIEDGHGRTNN